MKLIRMTTFFSMDSPPLVTVVEDASLAVPFEESMLDRQPGYLTITDRFEMPDSMALDDAVFEGIRRAGERETQDRYMAVLYFWNADHLRLLTPHGVLGNPAPAPLSSDDIAETLKQLALHPNYEGQTVITTSAEDGITCILSNGNVTKEEQ